MKKEQKEDFIYDRILRDLFQDIPKTLIENKALTQIKQKRYYEKYQECDEIYLVGIELCKQQRNVCGFVWELVSSDRILREIL